MSHIANAVAPLKNLAMDAAEAFARRVIKSYLEQLAAANWDAQAFAPYPHGNMSRADYAKAKHRYTLTRMLTEDADTKVCRSPRDPEPRKQSDANEARFIAEAREQAAASYNLYVSKLVAKVGDCDAAELNGGYVWDHSVLTITKGDTKEVWVTRQIVNFSKLGKVFNQWPTRKVGK